MAWKPSDEDYSDIFKTQNPWVSLNYVPTELAKPIRRPLASLLAKAVTTSQPHRYQLILGPRRVGKTTVMYQAVAQLLADGVPASRLRWLRLDHPLLMQQPLGPFVRNMIDMSGASPASPLFVFLDELIYADKWDLWLKTFYDEAWPVRVIGTSSSTAALRQGRPESGVGRWEEQYLAPWLFTEYLALRGAAIAIEPAETLAATIDVAMKRGRPGHDTAAELRRFLLIGGFPELLTLLPTTDETSELLRSQRVLRADAVERTLYRDLPQAYGIAEPMKLERLLYTLAGQIAGIVSAKKLATDLGLSQPTIDRYISYLEHAFLVFTLPNYSHSEESVQRRGRKLYFTDGAVRNAALQRGLALLRDPGEMGALYENAVAAHLHALSQQTGHRLFHWRHAPHEVDLVFDDPDGPLAFEVTSSRSHSLSGLEELQKAFPRFVGRSYLVTPEALPLSPKVSQSGIGRISLDTLLIAIGVQAEAALRRRLPV